MAKSVARSRLFGMDENQLVTLMLLAQSKGLHPIQAVERFHVIAGRPAMKADAMLAEFQAHGGVIEWHQHDHTKCEATFNCPGVKTPTTVSWSIEEAKKAELTKNGMYTKYPRQMLRARVISEGIRMVMPGIVCGIYTPEEVSDFDPAPAPVQREARIAPPPPHPDNNSGHGRGQYASPEQVEAYTQATHKFIDARNAQWLDEWTREDGSLEQGIGELLRAPQVTGHLLKWGLRTGRLAPVDMTFDPETGKPVERVSVEKAKKYVAILFARDREALVEEAEAYFRQEAEAARAEWRANHEAIETEEVDDIETTEAGARG
jgi:hypothetical protein